MVDGDKLTVGFEKAGEKMEKAGESMKEDASSAKEYGKEKANEAEGSAKTYSKDE
jgi:hypothetical protein